MRTLLLAVPFLALACENGGSGTDKSADTAATDSGASDSAGDTAGDTGGVVDGEVALDIQASIAEKVHTVVIVEWRTEAATSGYVEFGESSSYGHQTLPTAVSTGHRVLLLGSPADTEVHFRVVTDTGTELVGSKDLTITTLSLPSGFPTFTVSGDLGGRWNYQVMPTQGAQLVVTILDPLGRPVWYYAPEGRGNLMKAVLSHDRQHMIVGFAAMQDQPGTSVVQWISLDGAEITEVPLDRFDHDLTEMPDGTLLCIVVENRTVDGNPWEADTLVELKPDGSTKQIWNAWDAIDPTGLGLEKEKNWTHANAIEYVPSQDDIYLAMKGPGTVARIHRTTGEIVWMLNGKLNQFTFLDGAVNGVLQHQLEVLGDGRLLLFDNGAVDRGYSRAVELQLDEAALTAKELWEYSSVPPIYVYAKGDVQRFADDTTQVTWSTAGELQLVNHDGGLLWQLNAPLGQAFTFVQPVMSLYEDQ